MSCTLSPAAIASAILSSVAPITAAVSFLETPVASATAAISSFLFIIFLRIPTFLPNILFIIAFFCPFVNVGGFSAYRTLFFYSAVVSLRVGSSLSPVIMTGTTCHREGIVPPRRKVYIFWAVVIRFGFCKADCSYRLWCDNAVRFRVVPLYADRGAHVGRWTATASAPRRW